MERKEYATSNKLINTTKFGRSTLLLPVDLSGEQFDWKNKISTNQSLLLVGYGGSSKDFLALLFRLLIELKGVQ